MNLGSYEITLDTKIEQEKVLLRYAGVQLFAINALSCLVGYAKSRKSFLRDLFIGKMYVHDDVFSGDFTGKCIIIDTEQNKTWCKNSIARLRDMGVDLDRLHLYGIKDLSIYDRIEFIENAIQKHGPEMVYLDGIRDIVHDFNDLKEVSKVIEKIMSWIVKYNIHFATVLHLNPGSDKPKGALGTEIMCKADSIIRVSTRGGNTKVSPYMMRDAEFTPFYMNIDDNNIPYVR